MAFRSQRGIQQLCAMAAREILHSAALRSEWHCWGPLVFEDGYYLPPTGPGLGVELDMDVVEGRLVG